MQTWGTSHPRLAAGTSFYTEVIHAFSQQGWDKESKVLVDICEKTEGRASFAKSVGHLSLSQRCVPPQSLK